jgi:hypothetical protein
MVLMFRTATILLALLTAANVLAQTPPPGNPFDASRHPNPIITFVEERDFRPAASDQVKRDTGIDLLGLAQDEGKRQSIEIADGRFVKNMAILNVRTDVTFYPVVRQKFKLTGGADLVLCSFRFPKVALPKDFTRIVLNEAAIEKKKKPGEMRFGGSNAETLDIRGARALLFENGDQTIVYWQEQGIGHTISATIPQKELFRIIEDLL